MLLAVGKRWRQTERVRRVGLCNCGIFARELCLQAKAKGPVDALGSICLLGSGEMVCSMRKPRLGEVDWCQIRRVARRAVHRQRGFVRQS